VTSRTPKEIRSEVARVIVETFNHVDLDGDGSVRFSEFLKYHQSFAAQGMDEIAPSEETLEVQFRKYDVDSSQTLDKGEFECYMQGALDVLGARKFVETCKRLIEEDVERIRMQTQGYNRLATLQLVEHAAAVQYYTHQMVDVAERFLAARADPNFVDRNGSHALLYAAPKSNELFVVSLMEARADPRIHNLQFECAAFCASHVRDMDVLRALLIPMSAQELDRVKSKSAMDMEERERASEALVRHVADATTEQVRHLIAKRADINFRDDAGWTPLSSAVFWNRQDILEILLNMHTSPSTVKLRMELRNGRGRTALHIAARKGYANLVPPLVRVRADIDSQDIDGWTPLHHAAFNGMDEVFICLIEASCDMTLQDRNGLTPWMVTRLPSRSSNLSEKTLKTLEPPEAIAYSKAILPILKDEMTLYDKLQTLLGLPGVNQNLRNLRLHEQFFDPNRGPNTIRIQKMWECLALPMIRRLRNGETDSDEPDPRLDDDVRDRLFHEIANRRREQKCFVLQWLRDTMGPRKSDSYNFDNRACLAEEWTAVIDEELRDFQREFEPMYQELLGTAGDLTSLPAEEWLVPQKNTQLVAHTIPVWAETMDPAGAFEAFRRVNVHAMSRDDDEALMEFMELVTIGYGFDTGQHFWKNCYKLWLAHFAQMIDADFHKKVQSVVERFNEVCAESGFTEASYKRGKPKTYESMRRKEAVFGEPSHETYEGRTVASKLLDVVRGSIVVNSPAAVVALINDFFKPLNLVQNRMEVVRVLNRFAETSDTLQGFRNVELNVYWEGGLRSSLCNRPDCNVHFAIIGEVQINLENFLAVNKRRHLLYENHRGAFDWRPDDDAPAPCSDEEMGCGRNRRYSSE